MLGRNLHEVGDKKFTAQVATDAEAEIAAIGKAELGDLSGRARQAVVLTRQDASPVQVAAADGLLHQDPLGAVWRCSPVWIRRWRWWPSRICCTPPPQQWPRSPAARGP